MRKLLRTLRSSSSSLFRSHRRGEFLEQPSSSEHNDDDEAPNRSDHPPLDGSNKEDNKIGEDSNHQPAALVTATNEQCTNCNDDEDLINMNLEDLTRITPQDTKKERRYKYKQYFVRNKVIMTVTKDDLLLDTVEKEEEDGDEEYFDSDLYKGSLVIPRGNHSTVPNYCVICLEEYQPGSLVVWSTNSLCEHAFHQYCIVKYFDKIQRTVGETPCPCCRATYTDLQVEIRAIKRTRRGRRRRIRTTTGASTIVAGIPWLR